MTRIVLSALAAMLLATCVGGAGDPPKSAKPLRTAIREADKLIERTGRKQDIDDAKSFDGTFHAVIAVDQVDTGDEYAHRIRVNATLRSLDRDVSEYYGPAEKKRIARLAQAHQESVRAAMADDFGRTERIAAAHRNHREAMRPYVEASTARKDWYELTGVDLEIEKAEGLDVQKLLQRKSLSVTVTVMDYALLDLDGVPFGKSEGGRIGDPPKFLPRVGSVRCKAVGLPEGCERVFQKP